MWIGSTEIVVIYSFLLSNPTHVVSDQENKMLFPTKFRKVEHNSMPIWKSVFYAAFIVSLQDSKKKRNKSKHNFPIKVSSHEILEKCLMESLFLFSLVRLSYFFCLSFELQ